MIKKNDIITLIFTKYFKGNYFWKKGKKACLNYMGYRVDMELPAPLTKEEQLYYFQEMANGNRKAREILINHNLRLVSNEILNYFKNFITDKDELFSIGVIGLMKSIDNFDMSKNTEFSTYAVPMIRGEMHTYLRKQQKTPKVISMETSLFTNKDGKELRMADILIDDSDFVSDYEQKEIYTILMDIVKQLPFQERVIIKCYFGFYANNSKYQEEIANVLGKNQSTVSRIIKRIVNEIKLELFKRIMPEYYEQIQKKVEIKNNKNMQNIYELYKYYSKNRVDTMLLKLTPKERNLITKKYGEDLENPIPNPEWSKDDDEHFNKILYPKMNVLLAYPLLATMAGFDEN